MRSYYGQELVNERKKYLLTQQELASLVGVTVTTISYWETDRDKKHPSLKHQRKLKEIFKKLEKEG